MAELADYSEVGVANLALHMMGRGALLTSLSDNSQAARVMRLALPYARDAVLRSFPWNFAKARATIAAQATAPDFEFSHQYLLPTDPWCLRVLRVDGLDGSDWRIEGRNLLCNDSGPVSIKYVQRVTDLAQSDPLFVAALATRLAADTALSITESSAKAEDLMRSYQAKLREARAVNSQESQRDDFPQGDWHDARLQGVVQPYRDWDGV